MKKIVSLLIVAAMVIMLLPSFAACTPRENILNISNWEDYIAPEVLDGFKEYYKAVTGENIKIKYDALSSNEEMLQKISLNRVDYDILCPSDYMIEKMLREDLLIKLSTNLGNDINGNPIEDYRTCASPFSRNRDFDPTNEYAVGYMWGTMGILYNPALIKSGDEIKSWNSLWDPAYSKQILMKDSVRDSFVPASIYANRTVLAQAKATMTPAEYQAELTRIINDTEHAALTLAMNELIAQKPILKGYEVEQGKNDMIDGNATMSLQWAGDAVFSIDANPALKYVIPEEGSNLFFDGWVIPKYAGNVKAANLFINYMCKPEIAIQNMDYIGYTSVIASDEVIEYLNENYAEYPEIDLSYFFGEAGKSVHADPNMFPEAGTILRLAVMRDFGAAESKVNDMWNNVKSS